MGSEMCIRDRYIKDKVSYEDMPPDIVREYCIADVQTTTELAQAQLDELKMCWPTEESSFA